MTKRGHKDVEVVMREAEALGFTCSRTSKGHFKLEKAGCQTIFAGSTPSKFGRGNENTIAQLRRSARQGETQC